jgi:hypothetical protein
MLRRLSVLAFLIVLVTCGSRTQTPDGDPYGQAGSSQGASGDAISVTGGNNAVGVGGSTNPGNLCGSIECPAGSLCCPNCGICVSPDVPCPPDCFPGGAGGGFPGTGGSTFPGTGGTTFPGAGGFSTGAGGGACGSVGECQARLQTACPPGDACVCSTCSCQARACYADKGCLAIYNCMSSTNCTDPAGCFNTCGSIIMSFPGTSFPLAMSLQMCAQGSGCVRCARPVQVFDAGIGFCSLPPPPTGPVTCSVSAPGNGVSCTQACGDGSNKYYMDCSNGACSCNYDGKEICRCSYTAQMGCYSCCPPWAAMGFQ